VITSLPRVIVDVAVAQGNVKVVPPGKTVKLLGGGRTVMVAPPVMMVLGAVTVGRVRKPPLGSEVTTGPAGGTTGGRIVNIDPP
jgi:hypothetical protein